MDELQNYVESLFLRKRSTAKIKDLKEEIYSNLIAKKEDLMQQGYTEQEAIAMSKSSLHSIDELLDDLQLTYVNQFKAACWQTMLLYSAILWLLSIPTMILNIPYFSMSIFLLFLLIGTGYVIARQGPMEQMAFISVKTFRSLMKHAWFIWTIYFMTAIITVSAIQFGSNLWFLQPVIIDGPYTLGMIAVRYYVPLITILIPIAISRFPAILCNYEGNDTNEK